MICDVPLIDSEIQESALKFLYFCHIALQVSVYLKISMWEVMAPEFTSSHKVWKQHSSLY